MNRILVLSIAAFVSTEVTAEPRVPLRSGQYQFQHRYAEHPDMPSFQATVKIRGNHITIINPFSTNPFPKGVIAGGSLMWHKQSQQWIIVNDENDRKAVEVGGCSDGPEVVDLQNRIYWTC